NPSDRYNLAVPRSNAFRLRPEESGYDNVTLCGDWTLNPLSVGCLESATMSGIMAACALDAKVAPPVNDWLTKASQPKKLARLPFVLLDGGLLAPPPATLDVKSFVFELSAEAGALQV